jgi:ATP-dependent helicase Lhr and Lhr-like helicase
LNKKIAGAEVGKSIQKQLRRTFYAFFGGVRGFRDAQQHAIPLILDGRNVLITSPTGSGKTEAAVAPVLEMALGARSGHLPFCLYICPTRALVNDIEQRLEIPFEKVDAIVSARTGDRKTLTKSKRGHFLITTPESLDVMLVSSDPFLRDCLTKIHTVIIDEIHQFYGTARGLQLMLLLERLKLRTQGSLQRIALSATVARAERLAKWLQGSETQSVETVSIPGGRDIDVSLYHIDAPSSEAFLSGEPLIGKIQQILNEKKVNKVILFANTRSDCDWIYWKLSTAIRGYQILLHYSSISKEVREHTEERFKRLPMAVCIATSTLELGVDIGDVDAIFFYRAPRSISSFVQRLGRGNRRSTRVVGCGLIPSYTIDEAPVKIEEEALLFQALFEATESHTLERIPERRLFSVFIQQILSLGATYEKNSGEAKIDLPPLSRLAHPNFASFVSDESLTELLEGLEEEDYLNRDVRKGYFTFTDRMHDLKDSMSMWSNFSQGHHTTVVAHNMNLSSIPRGNLNRLQVGDAIMVAGKLQIITDISSSEVRTCETKDDRNYNKIVYESGEFPSPLEMSETCQIVLQQGKNTEKCIRDLSLKKRYAAYRSRFWDVNLTETVPFFEQDGHCLYYTFLGTVGNSILTLVLRDRLGMKATAYENRLITDSPLKSLDWIPSTSEALHQIICDNYKYFVRLIRPSSHFYRLTDRLKTEEICSYIWSEELYERLIELREKRLVELPEPAELALAEDEESKDMLSPTIPDQVSSLRLLLEWGQTGAEIPWTKCATVLTNTLNDVVSQATIRMRDGREVDDLNLEECISLLNKESVSEVDLQILDGGYGLGEKLTIALYEDERDGKKEDVELRISGKSISWIPDLSSRDELKLKWLQPDFDFPAPVSLLALPFEGDQLHCSALHGLVVIASQVGGLEEAKLFACEDEENEVLVARWHFERPKPVNGSLAVPLCPLVNGCLWLPDFKSEKESGDVQIWFEVNEKTIKDKKRPPPGSEIRQKIAEILDNEPYDLELLEKAVADIKSAGFQVEVKSLEHVELPHFMSPVQEGTVLVISPTHSGIVIGLDFNQPKEHLTDMILHAAGHLLLGHVRAGDQYGHGDTYDTIRGNEGLPRWDRAVQDSFPDWFPPLGKESLKDCTAQEKAWLGLWRIIGEVLGESRQLHQRAEKYQQAIYQRQAAQRLLAQLEEYQGAMLCDGVGLGKTYIATTLMVHYANSWRARHNENPESALEDLFRITVLAPNSVVSTWQREAIPPLAAHGVPLSTIRVVSHSKLSRISRDSEILKLPGRNGLSDFEHLLLSDLVIVDEAHNFRSVSARRTVVLRDLLRLQPRQEFRRRVLLLTATPVNNSLDDLQQEVALLFSRPLWLSDATTADGYRRQALRETKQRCNRARNPRGPKGDLASFLIHGDPQGRFSVANDFRDDLDFGPRVQRIGDYLKEQDRRLVQLQDTARTRALVGEGDGDSPSSTRIADELLDRIVVQRSRSLCKEIESQQGSDVELLFRADASVPEKLYYSDEYDGIKDVLAGFLSLFQKDGEDLDAVDTGRLSLKVYMWFDVREGIRSADEFSSVVGLQRVLVLKRLESSPVSFLITLLRLAVLHAHRLQQLLNLCFNVGDRQRTLTLEEELGNLLSSQDGAALEKVFSLATGDEVSRLKEEFLERLSKAYAHARPAADSDDTPPQLSLFAVEEGEESPERDQLERLWELRTFILQDLEILLKVTPDLADIVFGKFDRKEWPRRLLEGGEAVDWPKSANWGLRIITDAKLRKLVTRLIEARREEQKVIVFSQFSDSLAYIYSVLIACQGFERPQWATVVAGMGIPDLKDEEIRYLLDGLAIITGDTEDRDTLVNAFAPFYRIGPIPPVTEGAGKDEQDLILGNWKTAWTQAIHRPIDVLLSSDVLAEGVNLQDTSTLINFDVHWNPVRMIQRAGRIDRRLNPLVEKAQSLTELEKLANGLRKPVPKYYWHAHQDEAPLTVNMILPDELESELMLRERIATKTMAIDFTLGLEQGTGAEAEWMENYKYQGISSLNAFQKDRAIERIASYHEKFARAFRKLSMDVRWVDELNGWFRTEGSDESAPLIGRAKMGRRDGEIQIYTRYIEPQLVDDIPYWLWSQEKPGESLLNFWIELDSKTFPPATRTDIEWHPGSSEPPSADHLLGAAINLFDKKQPVDELPPMQVGRPLQQGATALSAGFMGSEDDRRQIAITGFFLLQIASFDQE